MPRSCGPADTKTLAQTRFIELAVPLEQLFAVSAKPQSAVKFDVLLRRLQQPFVFETLDVGQVAQGGEPKHLVTLTESTRQRFASNQ